MRSILFYSTLFVLFLFIDEVTARPMWTGQGSLPSRKTTGADPSSPKSQPAGPPVTQQKSFPELPPVGREIEGRFKAEGERQDFGVDLKLGEYLEIKVDQKGVDVAIELIGPSGTTVRRVDSPVGKLYWETLFFVTRQTGRYGVRISQVEGEAAAPDGSFRLTVTAHRPAGERDRALAAAQDELQTAAEYATKETKETRKKLLASAERAFTVFSSELGLTAPSTHHALVLFGSFADDRESILKVAGWFERYLEAFEKSPEYTPEELLGGVDFTWRLYLKVGVCEFKTQLERLLLKALALTEESPDRNEDIVDARVGLLRRFYEKCEPSTLIAFSRQRIEVDEKKFGAAHPKVLKQSQEFVQAYGAKNPEEVSQFINARLLATQGDDVERRALRVKLLRRFADGYASVTIPEKERSPQDPAFSRRDSHTLRENLRRGEEEREAFKKRASEMYLQALAIAEPDRVALQDDYAACLTAVAEPYGEDFSSVDRFLSYCDEIQRLDAPEVIDSLSHFYTVFKLKAEINNSLNACSPDEKKPQDRAETYLARITETVLRLGESYRPKAPPESSDSGEDSDGRLPLLKTGLTQQLPIHFASFLFLKGEADKARKVLERGLEIERRQPDSRGDTLISYAIAFDFLEDEEKAESLFQEARKAVKVDAEGVPDLVSANRVLLSLAMYQERRGEYQKAASVFQQVLTDTLPLLDGKADDEEELDDSVVGQLDDEVAAAIEGLMWNAVTMGDEAGFASWKKAYRKRYPEQFEEGADPLSQLKSPRAWTANWLMGYAKIYEHFGNRRKAESQIERFLAVTDDTPEFEPMLAYAAGFYIRSGKFKEALPVFERFLALKSRTNGPTAVPLHFTALFLDICGELRRPAKATAWLKRLIAVYEREGKEPAYLQYLYFRLAELYERTEQPEAATRVYRKLVPLVLSSPESLPMRILDRMVDRAWVSGDGKVAFQLQLVANQNRENRLLELGAYGVFFKPSTFASVEEEPDENKVDTCDTGRVLEQGLGLKFESSRSISMQRQLGPEDETACRLALESVLRRKNQPFFPPYEQATKLNEPLSPEEQKQFRQYDDNRFDQPFLWALNGREDLMESWEAAGLSDYRFDDVSQGDDTFLLIHSHRFEPLFSESEPVVAAPLIGVSPKSSFRTFFEPFLVRHPKWAQLLEPVTVEAVQKALPADGALVEVVRYAPFNPKTGTTEGEERYAVYVLTPQGEPKWFDGGTVGEVDTAANLLANEARDYADDESKAAVTVLENRFIAPALKLTGNAKRVYVAFDERLASLRLKKLMDAQGKPFGENRGLIFIRSGRELLTMNASR